MTKHKLNKIAQSLHKNSPIQKDSPTQQIQSNYYLSVASVDSNTTESTCIESSNSVKTPQHKNIAQHNKFNLTTIYQLQV